ncbi:MAG: YciI family protein [Hyphomicrobiales bacterium]|nr:YciI family protein [Nitratireductor sp.]MCC2098807.1 YciI family protein [Hyphomicrobiales bacterium]
MLFAIYGLDAPGKLSTRLEVRPENLKFLEQAEAKMLVAGPLLDQSREKMTGSLIIVDFPTREDVEDWVASSPLTKAGVYQHVEIHEFTVKWPRDLASSLGGNAEK